MKVAFRTLGCKVNLYESEALKNAFHARGFETVSGEGADVVIVNTCTVTHSSAAKSRKEIRRATRRNPDAVVAVLGCYSQLSKERVEAIEGVDIIMGTADRGRLIDYVEQALKNKTTTVDVKDFSHLGGFDDLYLEAYSDKTRAFLKIQDGCDQYCSYCIIPRARGPVRSRATRDVLAEAKRLVANGFKEIVLTGIHTGSYGKDLPDTTFHGLLDALRNIDGLQRLRISSIEMHQIDEALLALLAGDDTFAPHLHIPLQHGSDRILRRMRRRYSASEYEAMIEKVRHYLPDAAITTDVMCGYPGEEEADFQKTLELAERVGFSEMHVFPYSAREGTKAYDENLESPIAPEVKKARVKTLLALNESLAGAYREFLRHRRKPLEVLIEHCEAGMCRGHTGEYLYVEVEHDTRENTMMRVTLEDAAYPVSRAFALETGPKRG